MSQKKFISILGIAFWLFCFPTTYGTTIDNPQTFTNKTYSYYTSNNLDEFFRWVQSINLSGMNPAFKDKTPFFKTPSTILDTEAAYYTKWKSEYYGEFGAINQRKPFLLAGEFYPAVQVLQSTALSFYELSPVIRTGIIISGKLGNPIAENILMLEGIDKDLTTLLEGSDGDDGALVRLLQTPFVWNSIEAMNFLKDPARHDRVLAFINGDNPFVYLNGYFILTDILGVTPQNDWLEKAKALGSGLAALRLHPRGVPIDLSTIPATVAENLALQNARLYRYGIEGTFDRAQARTFYEEALNYTPLDPFLHLEIADFYKDLFIVDACPEVGLDNPEIIQRTLFHYKEAHDKGDGDAALDTVKFLSHLEEKGILIPPSNAWGLPHDDIPEALTLLYEAAYQRRDEPILLDQIKKLRKRTDTVIDEFKLKVIRNLNFRQSIIRFGE